MFNNEFIKNLNVEEVLHYHVQVPEVKRQLDLLQDENEFDQILNDKIEAAYGDAKGYTGNYFAKTSLEYAIYNFTGGRLRFDLTPLIAIKSLEVSDDLQTWDVLEENVDFIVSKTVNDFGIIFASNYSMKHIKLKLHVGYEIGELPAEARAAIVLKAGDMFDTERSGYAPQKIQILETYEGLLNNFYKTRIKVNNDS